MTDTKINVNNTSFISSTAQSLKIEWKIPEYFSLPKSSNYSLDSPSFSFANATWCVRWYLNEEHGLRTDVSFIRLHSSLPCHKIIFNLDLKMENRTYFNDQYIYDKFSYEENNKQEAYCTLGLPKRSELDTNQKKYAPDGTLILICHLLFEEPSDVCKVIQKDQIDHSNVHNRRDVQNSSIISLKSSSAQSLKVIWKIPNYFSLPDTLDYSLSCPSFDFGYATWCLKLYPNGTETHSEDTLIALIRLHSLVPSHKIIRTFDVTLKNEGCYNNCYIKSSFNEDHELKDLYLVVPKRTALFKDYSQITTDDNVTFLFHFFYEESGEKDALAKKLLHELDHCRILCQDMKNLLLNGEDYDLTLKVKDKEFRVHRNILKARSQVFKSMLTHDMIEKNSGIIKVEDCNPQIMEQFLLYLYCGKVDVLNKNNMLGLYYIADKYNVMQLKEECRDFICCSLSYNNICDVLHLSLNHTDKRLLECATEFFVNIANKDLTTCSKWIAFSKEHENIADELFVKVSKKWTEENKMVKNRRSSF